MATSLVIYLGGMLIVTKSPDFFHISDEELGIFQKKLTAPLGEI